VGVSPIPVVASSSVADGRGLAAVLVLGAAGINAGTRFLASVEAPVNQEWKRMIIEAESEDAVKFEAWNDIIPPQRSGGYPTSMRSIRTPFIDQLYGRRDEAKQEAESLQGELLTAMKQGRQHELVPAAGQSAGLVRDILPAGEIVRQMVDEAQQALERSSRLLI
jgi:nitronate monooxygenase/enoyl-[acyl-carrier protein] reductase II